MPRVKKIADRNIVVLSNGSPDKLKPSLKIKSHAVVYKPEAEDLRIQVLHREIVMECLLQKFIDDVNFRISVSDILLDGGGRVAYGKFDRSKRLFIMCDSRLYSDYQNQVASHFQHVKPTVSVAVVNSAIVRLFIDLPEIQSDIAQSIGNAIVNPRRKGSAKLRLDSKL